MRPSLAWRPFNTALVEFPWLDKIDHFVPNDRDKKTESLNLSLRYSHEGANDMASFYIKGRFHQKKFAKCKVAGAHKVFKTVGCDMTNNKQTEKLDLRHRVRASYLKECCHVCSSCHA